jgi:Coatomer epsilon subunit
MTETTSHHQPDELYTLRTQFWLGHYAMALQEAKQMGRRPLALPLKVEREEFVLRCYIALHQYDKCLVSATDGPGKFFRSSSAVADERVTWTLRHAIEAVQ